MKAELDRILENNKIMIIDGSMSTPLERMGADLNDELWTAKVLREQPELIKKVHKDYLKAGADCGITASYQATIPGLMAKGMTENEAEDLIAESVRVFLEARDEWWKEEGEASGREYPLCLASVGPYGAYLADGSEYRGRYAITDSELSHFHRRRLEVLRDAGADMYLIETIPSRREAVIVADLAEEMGLPYWVSYSCMSGTKINEGDLIRDCVRELAAGGPSPASVGSADSPKGRPGLKMVGANCTDPKFMVPLIGEIKAGLEDAAHDLGFDEAAAVDAAHDLGFDDAAAADPRDISIAVYPNSGEKYDPHTKTWTRAGEGLAFGAYAFEYMKAGARAVGGCCTTVASHIEQVAEARKRFLGR